MKTLQEIKNQVETEYEMGGLSAGIYGDYAEEVAIRYAKEIEDNRIEETKAWKPEIGETYWYIESDGDIFYRSFENEEICNHIQQFGNYFKTKALATQARDAIKELLLDAKKV